MDPLRLDTLAAQVVAWHNRHPLARRITAAQVQSMGYVVLPGLMQKMAAAPLAAPGVEADHVPAAQTLPQAGAPGLAAVAGPLDAQEDAGQETHPDTARAAEAPAFTLPAAPEAVDAELPAAEAPAADVEPATAPATEPDAEADDGSGTGPATEPATQPATEPDAALHAGLDANTVAALASAPIDDIAQGAIEALANEAAATAAAADPGPPAEQHTPPGVAGAAAHSLRARLAARPALPAPGGVSQPASAAPLPAAGAAPSGLRLAFTEPFFEHASPRQVAQWAQKHARVLAVHLPAAAPVRHVRRDPALIPAQAGEQAVDLLLRTATIELGAKRLRLLVGPGNTPAVLGPHLWSSPRCALAVLPAVAAPAALALALGLGPWRAGKTADPIAADAPVAAASAAEAPASAAAAASRALAAASSASAAAAVSTFAAAPASASAAPPSLSAVAAAAAAQAAAAAAAAASAPPLPRLAAHTSEVDYPDDVEPELGRVQLPAIGPLHNDLFMEPTRLRRQALRAAQAAAALAAASAPDAMAVDPALAAQSTPPAGKGALGAAAAASGVAPTTIAAAGATAARQMPASAADPTPATPPEYVLATRLLRTAAESELLHAAMNKLLQGQAPGALRVHRVAVGDDWRVVGGPFASQASAEQMRALLAARGVKTELMDLSATAASSAHPTPAGAALAGPSADPAARLVRR